MQFSFVNLFIADNDPNMPDNWDTYDVHPYIRQCNMELGNILTNTWKKKLMNTNETRKLTLTKFMEI